MEYLLVFQWPTSTTKDYDLLIMLEEAARAGIGDLGIVDGRDIGSGEMNILVCKLNLHLSESNLFLPLQSTFVI